MVAPHLPPFVPLLWCHATKSSPFEGTATGLSSAVEAALEKHILCPREVRVIEAREALGEEAPSAQ